jgi:hypothetical protein
VGVFSFKTYNPTDVASVRRFDEARNVGAKLLEEQSRSKSVITPALMTLLKERKSPK